MIRHNIVGCKGFSVLAVIFALTIAMPALQEITKTVCEHIAVATSKVPRFSSHVRLAQIPEMLTQDIC